MNIFTQPTITKNTNPSFKGYYRPAVKSINSTYVKRADYLISILNDANIVLKKLNKAKMDGNVKKLLDYITSELKISKFNQTDNTIVFNNGNSNFIVATDGINRITLQEQNKDNGAIDKTIQIENKNITNKSETMKQIDIAEDFLQRLLDAVDFSLLKFRRITSKEENLKIINSAENFIKNHIVAQNEKELPLLNEDLKAGILPKELLDITDEIETIYKEIFSALNSVPNPVTRSKLKNGYYNIIKANRGTRNLGFKKDNYSIFVNFTNDHSKRYLILQHIYDNGEKANLIVNKGGKAYKQKVMQCLNYEGGKVEFYSQEEVDSPKFKARLVETRNELNGYLEFIKERINLKNKKQELRSTSDVGIVSNEALELCKKAEQAYNDSKTVLATLHDVTKKNKAKDFFGISAKKGSPSFILRNITDKKEDLQISFPIIDKIKCTKILVLEGINSIKQSFFIRKNNLVKFEAKKLGKSIRKEYKIHYYSQKEIDSFNLEKHLKSIVNKLEIITNGIYQKEYK